MQLTLRSCSAGSEPRFSVMTAAICVQRQDVCNGSVERRGNALFLSKLDHAARKPTDFEPVAALQVMMHRRCHIGRYIVGELQPHLRIVRWNCSAMRTGHFDDLLHDVMQEGAGLRIRANRPDGLANCCSRSRKGDKEYVLLPYLAHDVGREFGIDPSGQACGKKVLSAS